MSKMTFDFITADVIKSAIANHLKTSSDDIVVESLNFKPGSKKGENFATEIAAVTIQFSIQGKKQNKIEYICKYNPPGSAMTELLQKVTGN